MTTLNFLCVHFIDADTCEPILQPNGDTVSMPRVPQIGESLRLRRKTDEGFKFYKVISMLIEIDMQGHFQSNLTHVLSIREVI